MPNTAKNKVLFGVSNLHVGLYTVSDAGVVTLGEPMKVPGTVSLSLEPDSESNTFYADNIKYHTSYSDNGFTGEIENALFDDDFKVISKKYLCDEEELKAKMAGVANQGKAK
jgi:phi13 family phage major tail protein